MQPEVTSFKTVAGPGVLLVAVKQYKTAETFEVRDRGVIVYALERFDSLPMLIVGLQGDP